MLCFGVKPFLNCDFLEDSEMKFALKHSTHLHIGGCKSNSSQRKTKWQVGQYLKVGRGYGGKISENVQKRKSQEKTPELS